MIVLVTGSTESAEAIAEHLLPERVKTKGPIVVYSGNERNVREMRLAASLARRPALEVNGILRWFSALCLAVTCAPVLPVNMGMVPPHRVEAAKAVSTTALYALALSVPSLIVLDSYGYKRKTAD